MNDTRSNENNYERINLVKQNENVVLNPRVKTQKEKKTELIKGIRYEGQQFINKNSFTDAI